MNSSIARIGIIGTGVGVRTLLPGFRHAGHSQVVAISGSCEARAREVAQAQGIPEGSPDFRALCERDDVDLVCVASPNVYHLEHASHAIKSNKHVLCEKPLAMNTEEALALATLAKSSSRFCLVDHQLRFNPYFVEIRRQLAIGTIGRPYFIRMHQQSIGFSDRAAAWNWSFEAESGGGVRLAMASHFADLLWFWFGKRVVAVGAVMDPVVGRRKNPKGEDVEVRASSFFGAHMELDGGVNVHLSATAAACGIGRFDVSIYGTDGELHFDLDGKLRAAYLSRRGQVEAVSIGGVLPEEQQNKVSFFAGSFRYFAPVIVDAILSGDRRLLVDAATFDDAVQTQRVLDAMLTAWNTDSDVKLTSRLVGRASIV